MLSRQPTSRMFKKAVQRGRSEREVVTRCISGATGTQDVEALSEARTKLEAFFNILLRSFGTVIALATETLGKMSLLGSCRCVIVDVSVSLAISQVPHEGRDRVAQMKRHL
jgi:hypothetical protein